MQDEETAFHEAGHVVAALILDRVVEWVTLDVEGGFGGRTRVSDDGVDEPTRLRSDIIIAHAGPFAEAMQFGTANRGAMSDDIAQVMTRLGPLARAHGRDTTPDALGAFRVELAAEAQRLIAENWSSIALVARHLLTRRTLLHGDVAELLGM